MTTDQRHGACATPEAQTTQSQREWILAAVLFGLLLVEGIREGGFWPSDSLFVAIVSIVVLVVGMVLVPPDRRSMLLVGSVVLLALWWLVRALTAETIRSFLPLGASMLAFPAAFVAVRPLVGHAATWPLSPWPASEPRARWSASPAWSGVGTRWPYPRRRSGGSRRR